MKSNKILFIISTLLILALLISLVKTEIKIRKLRVERKIVLEEINNLNFEINEIEKEIEIKKRKIKALKNDNSIYEKLENQFLNLYGNFEFLGKKEVTGYNLSEQSCGKEKTDPGYGITRYGYNLKNKDREDAMTVASNIYKKGTKLIIIFEGEFKDYTGIYTVRDTGNPEYLKNRIDLFMGEEYPTNKIINKFGVQKATVIKIK